MNLNDLKSMAGNINLGDIKEKATEMAHTVAEKAGEVGNKLNNDTVKNLADKVGAGAKKIEDALGNLPGAAVDEADDDKTSPCLEKQETNLLNNNPRNDDM